MHATVDSLQVFSFLSTSDDPITNTSATRLSVPQQNLTGRNLISLPFDFLFVAIEKDSGRDARGCGASLLSTSMRSRHRRELIYFEMLHNNISHKLFSILFSIQHATKAIKLKMNSWSSSRSTSFVVVQKLVSLKRFISLRLAVSCHKYNRSWKATDNVRTMACRLISNYQWRDKIQRRHEKSLRVQ